MRARGGGKEASQPLRPRGRFEFETFGTQSPKSFEFKSASRPKKQRPRAKNKILPCTFLGGGAEKRTASLPLEGGMLRLCGYMPPAAQTKIGKHPPFGGGNARGFQHKPSTVVQRVSGPAGHRAAADLSRGFFWVQVRTATCYCRRPTQP